MDVSLSVTGHHYELQKQGLIQAFEDPHLQQVILQQHQGVAIQLQQFGSHSEVILDWKILQTPADIRDWTQMIKHMPRTHPGMNTAVGEAIRSGIQQMQQVPCEPDQKVIDVSADGENNVGVPAHEMRDIAQQHHIQVNGLAILNEVEPELQLWFQDHVITQDGFVVAAEGMEDFGRAIRRKLTLEISQR